MTNITRTDPFQELERAIPFRDLEGFFGWPRSLRRWVRDMPDEPQIRLEVTEDDKAFHVKADVPGVKKEDIAVEVDGNQVTVTAEVKRESEKKEGENIVHCERFYGKQSRTFTLGRDIDRAKVEAKLTEGVLELTLPKTEAAPSQRIAIK